MTLFDRLRKALTPTCGHEPLIAEMTAALAKVTLERDKTGSERAALQALLDLKTRDWSALREENAKLRNQLQGELSMRQLGDRRIRDLQTQLEREQDAHATTRTLLTAAIDKADDAASALEETTSRIALLEQQLRDATREDDDQAAMPFELAEAGGEAPIVDDELISDSTMTTAYRLVGIFFDEGRHHWLLASGENTIKAPIHDPEFREQLKRRGVSFAPGDALKADFRVLSFRKPDGDVYAKYSVEKVHQIIAPDEQLPLAEVTRD